ncbi:hypothetical protein TNCV_462991 [Trichonephila clavipes]|nr:hypothetical protein TNCV_462991 [Trichonephila clavipes]
MCNSAVALTGLPYLKKGPGEFLIQGPLKVSATPMFVRRMKGLLRRALGREILSYEELLTLCFNCEGIINSYPLTYRSEDLIAIPPDTFLMPNTSAEVTDLDLNDFAKFK